MGNHSGSLRSAHGRRGTASPTPTRPAQPRSTPRSTSQSVSLREASVTVTGPPQLAPKPKEAQIRVRCPTCNKVLIAPPGMDLFLCPCGSRLQRPAAVAPHMEQSATADVKVLQPQLLLGQRNRVRCPRCMTICEQTNSSDEVIVCRCGLHLLAAPLPPVLAATSVLEAGSKTLTAKASVGNLLVITSEEGSKGSQIGNWRRRIANSEKLAWKRIWTEAEECAVMNEECTVMEGLTEEALQTLSIEELKEKLKACLIEEVDSVESKLELMEKALLGVSFLSSKPELHLRKLLEDRNVDHSICQDPSDLAARLFAYEWSKRTTTKCIPKDAFVRRFKASPNGETFLESVDAAEFFVSTRLGLEAPEAPAAVSAKEILQVSQLPYTEKCAWFKEQLGKLRVPWEVGHVKLRVNRSRLLQDSYSTFLQLRPEEMRRFFRFEFIDEPGLDAGGVAREWFETVTDTCFNADFGLFEYGGTDNVCYQISPNSGYANDLHLRYFRFLGRLLGKALFDNHTINPHLTRVFYKHLLAWPISESDIEFIDAETARSTKALRECEDVSVLCLDFTMNVNVFGETQTRELKPGGANIEVTNENLDEYLLLRLKYIALDRVGPQLHEFLIGVYETVPMALLSVFDYSELELLLCGLPEIDVDDWQKNTTYRGAYAKDAENHPTIKMFWELMRESNMEQRARFLQFATGTSRVPVQGFSALQGNDGNIKLFMIDSVELKASVFPKAHTCFNRIDLPLYTTKEEMVWRVAQALSMEGAVGFGLQ